MRKATWAILIWTGLMVLWAVVGVQGIADTPATSDAEEVGRALGAGIGVTFIFIIWFIGFIILSIIWLMSRPKNNVAVFGPQGQQMMVTEQEAKRAVARGDWSYQPRYGGQPPYTGQAPYPQQPPYAGPPPPGGQPPQAPPGTGWRQD